MFASRTNWTLHVNRFARALEERQRSGVKFLDLTQSNPTASGLVYPKSDVLAALANPRALSYHPESKGLRESREAISDYYTGRASFGPRHDIDPEWILLTSGTSEAYSHIFRLLCEPGDEVLVPAPGYPLFEVLADLADIRLVSYPLLYDHGWQMDLASLRAAITPRSRALLVVHPNNPTGSFVKPNEGAALGAICAAHDMAIIADEVFLDYAVQGDAARTFATHETALTFTLSGLSKISLLPQMKLAWMVVSGPQAQAQAAMERLEIIADTYLSPSTPVQLASRQFLELRKQMQRQVRERVEENLVYLDSALREAAAVQRLEREGGWYAILRVPATGLDEELAVSLLERRSVLVHPGSFFNLAADGFVVLSLITPAHEFKEGVRRLLSYFCE